MQSLVYISTPDVRLQEKDVNLSSDFDPDK